MNNFSHTVVVSQVTFDLCNSLLAHFAKPTNLSAAACSSKLDQKMSVKEIAKRTVPIENKDLYVPDLDELASVIQSGLQLNYKEAECTVVDCPDLTKAPYRLAAKGLCGNARLVAVGGVPYLLPLTRYKEKVYDFQVIKDQVNLPGAFILGAGAGSKYITGVCCELIPNMVTSGGDNTATDCSHICKVNTATNGAVLEKYNCSEFNMMCDLYCSEGKPGKVLCIKAKYRTGEDNLVTCMRLAIEKFYGKEKAVGLGGSFLVKSGKLKTHVMPDFSETPLNTKEDVNNWLNFYTMSAPFVCMSFFISHDPGLDLRLEHSHGYSIENSEGGHYHTDVTPEEVEYEGYYSIAEKIYRVDRPEVTHMLGRE